MVNIKQDISNIHIEELDGIKYWSIPSPVSEQWTIDTKKENDLYAYNLVSYLQIHITNKKNLVFHLNYCNCKLFEELKNVFDCKIITTIHFFEWCHSLFGNVTHFRKIISNHDSVQDDIYKKVIEVSYADEKDFFELTDHIICLSKNMLQILQSDYKISSKKITLHLQNQWNTIFVPVSYDKKLYKQLFRSV